MAIFHFHIWKSVKGLIYFCELVFAQMYDLCRWKFLHKIHQNFSYGATLLKHIDIGTDYFEFVYKLSFV